MMGMLKAAEAPELKLEMEAMQRTTASYCDEWNRRHQQLLDNDKYLKSAVDGKGDFTAGDKEKLDGIDDGANKTVVDVALDETSENPIQNAAVAAALKALTEEIDKIKEMLPSLAAPTAADTGKILKIDADGNAVWAEDYGSSWKARYPEFLSGEDTDISDKKHIVSEDDFGFQKITDRDDKNITETLYDSAGVKIAQKETVVGSEHVIGRLVVDDESEESGQSEASE